MENPTKKTHPLILLAAASVTLFSLAGTATLLGWRPFAPEPASLSTPAPSTPPASTLSIPAGTTITVAPSETPNPVPKAASPAPKPVPTPVAKVPPQPRDSTPLRQVSNHDNQIDVIPAAPTCRNCGTVDQVREVKSEAQGSGLGAIAGGVLGGVLGNQVGGGTGKKLATVAGAIGGAYAGHQIEKNTRATSQYEIRVVFDDGSHQTITQDSPPAWRAGDRVILENGVIRAR